MFIAVVHNDKTMPLIKKMHYLKDCFKGEAAGVISRIELNAEGYEMASWLSSLLSVLIIRNDDWKVIYTLKGDSMKKQRDIGRDRFLIRRFPNMRTEIFNTISLKGYFLEE